VYRALGEDQWIAISVRDDRDWRALGGILGDPPWHADAELATADGRRRRHDDIDAHIEAWTSVRCARDVEIALQEAGVPAGAVLNYRQLRRDPQLNARGILQELAHPKFGLEVRTSSLWERGNFPQPIDRPAPVFGQHNDEVLRELLDMPPDAIDTLRRDGVIGDEILAVGD
jgi:crotonobetainyl-CoA:carnitine CoA-transferase CaiB-like acyl-CoA transferase